MPSPVRKWALIRYLRGVCIARLAESIRRAGDGIKEPRRILLADLRRDFDSPPASTLRRIIREWSSDGIEIGGHAVRAQKLDGRLYLVISPGAITQPSFHHLGRVVAL